MSIPLIVVAGPTASGKTSLAIALAKHYNGEVVSADSMQIYKGMTIATAKPTKLEMGDIPHHLIDFVQPEQEYSVAEYVQDASRVIADIISRGKQPIVAGGTGLYIRSLITNTQFEEIETDERLRSALYEYAKTPEGLEEMYQYLSEIDPQSADRIHKNNIIRVVRAIEVYRLTGKTMTQMQAESRMQQSPYGPIAFLGMDCHDRSVLYDRINTRVDVMMQNGLLEEAKEVLSRENMPTAYQAIGYKELADYFMGKQSLEEALEHLRQSSRRYAKRQLTWFRKEEGIQWLYREDYSDEKMLVAEAVGRIDSIFGRK